MTYVLGIDLGTTYTSAAVAEAGKVTVAQLGTRSSVIPTVVFLTEEGDLLTGDAANRRGVTSPARVAREFKRRVGDSAPLLLGGSPMAPHALMATVLRWVLDRVGTEHGGPPAHVAVTHPANWGPYKLDLLQQAVRLADLETVTTISEPEAAACYYSSTQRLAPGEIVAVYDLGGGTFDAAIVQATDDGFQILGAPEGIEHLGGIDVDEAVLGFVVRQLDGALDRLDLDDPVVTAAAARLRRDCVEAKEALSSDTETVIPVMLPGFQTEVRITRAELEAMVRPSLVATIGALERALRSAQVPADDLTAVLLVGGSSRMPIVAQLVGEALGRPVTADAHPKHAVSLGAALAAEAAHARSRGVSHPAAEIVAPVSTPPVRSSDLPPPSPPPPPGARSTVAAPAPPLPDAAPAAAAARLDPPAPPSRPAGAGEGALATVPPGAAVPPPATGGSRTRRRALIAGVPLAAVVAGVIVFATRGDDGGDAGAGADSAGSLIETESSTPATADPDDTTRPTDSSAPDDSVDETTARTAPPETTSAPTTTSPGGPDAQIAGLTVERRIEVGDAPDGVTIDGAGRVWVAAAGGASRIDPTTGTVDTVALPEGAQPMSIAAADDAVVVTVRNTSLLAIVDPDTLEHTPITVSGQSVFLAWGDGALWSVANDGWVDRIDPATWQVTASIAVESPAGVAIASGAAWVTETGGNLAKIDLQTNEVVARFPVGARPDGIATDGEALWIANRGDGTVARFDVATEVITHWVDVGTAPAGVVIDGERIWVTDVSDGTLVLVDRANPSVVQSIAVGAQPLSLATAGDRVWVTLMGDDVVAEVVVASSS